MTPVAPEVRRRRGPLALLVAVLLLLVAEAAMRVASPHLPDLLEWRDWQTQNKFEAMNALSARGGASIVTLGTSQMNAGLDPAQLGRLLKTRRPVFNASLNGSSMRTFEPWVLDVVLPKLRPDVVVLGLNVAEINDNNLVGEDSHRRFVNGIGYVRESGKGPILDRIEAKLGGWSRLVRERTLLRSPSKIRKADPQQRRAVVNALGEPRSIHIFDGAKYFVKEEWVQHVRSQVLQGYHVGGREMSALGRLVGALRARGIAVVIVRMPMTRDAFGLHPEGSAGFEAVAEVLRSFAARAGASYLDFMPRFPTTDYFFDPGHLNDKGRDRFTRGLAQELQALHALPPA